MKKAETSSTIQGLVGYKAILPKPFVINFEFLPALENT